MATKSYNGWSAFNRTSRAKQFRSLRAKGCFPKQDHCQMCGAEATSTFGHHAEEYGPTVEDYLRHCYYLCPACHGLLHVRHRFPNRWFRYLKNISEGVLLTSVTNMGQIYAASNKYKDIGPVQRPVFGNWVDDLPAEWYKGPDKIPTKRVKRKGELITVEEDFSGIDFLQLGIEFDFNTMGTGND